MENEPGKFGEDPSLTQREESVGGFEQNIEESPKDEIVTTVNRIEDLDKKIVEASIRVTSENADIERLRGEIGVGTSSLLQNDNDEISGLKSERNALAKQRDELIEEIGRNNLPDGLVVETGEFGRTVNGLNRLSGERVQSNVESEQAERRRWLEEGKVKAVEIFENAMRSDWHTSDAVNIEIAIEVMKKKVPDAMEKRMKNFVDGDGEDLPSVVWLHWECNSLFDRILGKSNMIRGINVMFGNEAVQIAGEEDLKPGEEEQQQGEGEHKQELEEDEPRGDNSGQGDTPTDSNSDEGVLSE